MAVAAQLLMLARVLVVDSGIEQQNGCAIIVEADGAEGMPGQNGFALPLHQRHREARPTSPRSPPPRTAPSSPACWPVPAAHSRRCLLPGHRAPLQAVFVHAAAVHRRHVRAPEPGHAFHVAARPQPATASRARSLRSSPPHSVHRAARARLMGERCPIHRALPDQLSLFVASQPLIDLLPRRRRETDRRPCALAVGIPTRPGRAGGDEVARVEPASTPPPRRRRGCFCPASCPHVLSCVLAGSGPQVGRRRRRRARPYPRRSRAAATPSVRVAPPQRGTPPRGSARAVAAPHPRLPALRAQGLTCIFRGQARTMRA